MTTQRKRTASTFSHLLQNQLHEELAKYVQASMNPFPFPRLCRLKRATPKGIEHVCGRNQMSLLLPNVKMEQSWKQILLLVKEGIAVKKKVFEAECSTNSIHLHRLGKKRAMGSSVFSPLLMTLEALEEAKPG
jgi:hypothetical protein